MFSVSEAYKTAVEESGRITKVTIAYDDVTITSEDVLSYFKYSHELPMDSVSGFVGKFPAAKVNYRLIAKQPGYDFLSANRTITITASLKVGSTFEDVLLGTFIVTNEIIDKVKDEIIIEALDASIRFDKPYAITPTFPMTVKDWVLAICAEVGVVLGSASWLNSTLTLAADPMNGESYRNAIQMVAESCGKFARIGRDNKLYFVGFTSSGRTIHEVFDYKLADDYGPVNSLLLSRDPVDDDLLEVNQPSIDLYGETRIKIDNNPILDADRATLIGSLFDALDGFEMSVTTLVHPGDPSLDIGDEILFIDDESVSQSLKITSISFEHTGSWSGTLMAVAPGKTDIDADYTGDISTRIKKAEIKVNKLTGEIQIIGNQVDIITGDYYDGILEGAKYTFDGTMATFLGGGLKIKNNASVEVFYADVDGNLVLKGTLNAGAVIGSTITGSDIIGGTFKTNDTGDRIEISGNRLVSIKSGVDVVSIDLDGITFYDSFDNVGAGVRYLADSLKLGSRYAFTEPRMDWSSFLELSDGGMTLESSQDWFSGIYNRISFYSGSVGDKYIDIRASDDTNIAAIELHPTTQTVKITGTLNVVSNIRQTGDINARFAPIYIASGTDLNSLTTPGMYYCPSNATAATLINCPVPYAFSLLVEKHAGVKQTLTMYPSNDVRTWVRNFYSSWGSWYQIITANGMAVDSEKLDGFDSSYFQQALVSGTNIKTINGVSILGSGDLVISATVDWSQIFDDSLTYRGYKAKAGSSTGYMRTPSEGLLPYESNSAGSGYVGTPSWPFLNMYAKNIYQSDQKVLAIAGQETTNPRTLKMSDGTIIKSGSSTQSIAITGAYGGGFYTSSTITITFDTSFPFTTAPSVSIFVAGAVGVTVLTISTSTTTCTFQLMKYGSTAAASYTIYYNAIGR